MDKNKIKYFLLYNKTFHISLLFFLSIVFLIISINKGKSQDESGDFFIFWKAGKNFIEGNDIYQIGLQDGGFTYPPFAAMLYQPVGFLDYHYSAAIYDFIVNYLLVMASIYIIFKIFKKYYPDKNVLLPLILAVVLSIRYLLHNHTWIQANIITFFVTLLGIYNHQKGKVKTGYFFLLFGMFFKFTPIIFLVYFLYKRKKVRDFALVLLLSLPFLLLPVLFRGLELSMKDWKDYYYAFILPFSEGKIQDNIISLGIPSLLLKLNSVSNEYGFSNLLNLKENILKGVVQIIQIIILLSTFFIVIIADLKKKLGSMEPYILSLLFLLPLLILGRVWEHHHVVLLFVYTFLLIIVNKSKHPSALFKIILLTGLFVNIIGKDTVGDYIYSMSQWYSFITINVLFIWILIVYEGSKVLKSKNTIKSN